MKVRCTYRYRLYDGKQNKRFDDALAIAAEIWNHCIALHRRYYKLTGKHLSANRLKTHITKLKRRKKYEHWNQLGSQAIQDVVERIERSYQSFFAHTKEHRSGRKAPPKFRKICNYSSFTLKQAGYRFEGGNRVTIMGHSYKFVCHRPLDGEIKTLTVKRMKTGKYFLCVSVIRDVEAKYARTGKAVGIDFGLKSFLTFDDGEKLESPLWYAASLPEIRLLHRNLSRCTKGSGNRKRAKKHLALKYEELENQRRDYFFKLANHLFETYDVVCLEDLNIDGMKRLWGRKVSDLAFSEFVSILQWVAASNDKKVSLISRWYPSSKMCNVCGTLNSDLTLDTREWMCPCCGTHHDRDVNAAINIRNEGLRSIGAV